MAFQSNSSEDMRTITRWATRIFVLDNPCHHEIKQGLADHCYALENSGQEESTVAPGAKGNMFESKFNFFQHDNEAVRQLRDYCLASVHRVGATVNGNLWLPNARVQVRATESWCHITRSGGYHDVHAHPMCSWCGIYYIDPGETDAAKMNGCNRFYEPRPNVVHFSDYATQYLYQEGSIDLPPKEGQLVIFPSYMRHAALPYSGQDDRIVVAFNTVTQCVTPGGAG